MWDFISDLLFDLLPKPVRIGCLIVCVLLLATLFLWLWLR